MKQTLIIVCLFLCAGMVDLSPIVLDEMKADMISVKVEGAVEHPGYIELPLYAAEQEALDRAGLLENADLSSINPMTILKDKDYINVPFKKEAQEAQRVSINTGTVEELCSLEGIGEGTAEKIIEYRGANGLFQTIEDLMRVKGIGQAKFDKIKDLICL